MERLPSVQEVLSTSVDTAKNIGNFVLHQLKGGGWAEFAETCDVEPTMARITIYPERAELEG